MNVCQWSSYSGPYNSLWPRRQTFKEASPHLTETWYEVQRMNVESYQVISALLQPAQLTFSGLIMPPPTYRFTWGHWKYKKSAH